MRLVSSNLANYHATVQKILIRQVLSDQTDGMKLAWAAQPEGVGRHCPPTFGTRGAGRYNGNDFPGD